MREQGPLYALDEIRAARSHTEVLAGGEQSVPQGLPAGCIVDVDLESALLGPSRSCRHEFVAGEGQHRKAEEADVAHLIAEHSRKEIVRLGPLNGNGSDTRLEDTRVKAQTEGKTLAPQRNVGIGEGDPETVFRKPQNDRIVDHASRLVHQGRIGTPARRQAGDVARRHQLHEAGRVRTHHLDLLFAGDIPDLNMPLEVMVVVLEPTEERRQQHVVVDGEAAYALCLDP